MRSRAKPANNRFSCPSSRVPTSTRNAWLQAALATASVAAIVTVVGCAPTKTDPPAIFSSGKVGLPNKPGLLMVNYVSGAITYCNQSCKTIGKIENAPTPAGSVTVEPAEDGAALIWDNIGGKVYHCVVIDSPHCDKVGQAAG